MHSASEASPQAGLLAQDTRRAGLPIPTDRRNSGRANVLGEYKCPSQRRVRVGIGDESPHRLPFTGNAYALHGWLWPPAGVLQRSVCFFVFKPMLFQITFHVIGARCGCGVAGTCLESDRYLIPNGFLHLPSLEF
jgi:hypothetical protein